MSILITDHQNSISGRFRLIPKSGFSVPFIPF